MPIHVFGRHNVLTRIVFAATQWIGLSDVLLASQSFRDRFECKKEMLYPMSPLANWSSELHTSRIGWRKLPTNAKQTK